MRKFLLTVIALGVAGSGAAGCTYCPPNIHSYNGPGPELTGDYSRQYLYSSTTRRMYADPVHYYASAAVTRWKARSSVTTSQKRTETQLEK